MDQFHSSQHVVRALAPSDPVLCQRPHAAERAARWFVDNFPGEIFYAVKANPDGMMLDAIAAGGVNKFDVASLAEVRATRARFPKASLAFMNPVKAPEAIAEAYFDHGVRIFSLDSGAELSKILKATNHARDLTLCVRIGVDNSDAVLTLGRKFGARGPAVPELIRQTRLVAEKLGVCFHVGSQAMAPGAYARALDTVEQAVVQSGVLVDIIDVGGGFPARYPDMDPGGLKAFFEVIEERFETFLSTDTTALWCEPGRALVAEAASLLVRVEGRRDFDLYINDGVYGTLYDAGHLGWRYPARVLGREGMAAPFRLYGPTCDDADYMPGPFFLPADAGEGDFIEIGMLGAYGRTMAGQFNGYGSYTEVVCTDDPFGSIYLPAEDQRRVEASQ